MSDLQQRLRRAANTLRLTSMPLADLIPLLQQAADALEAQPAQAVPLLTDEDFVRVIRPMCNSDQSAKLLLAASRDEYRAIESLVRSKLEAGVPMTRQQTDAMFAEVQRRANQLADEGRYTFGGWSPIAVELIEAHHGIVGKEGGNANV